MKKRNIKQKENSLLDQTVNDFDDHTVLFRYPKYSTAETQVTDKVKSKGRPSKLSLKKASNVSSQSSSVVSTVELSKNSTQGNCGHVGQSQSHPVSDQEVNGENLDEFSELEKSICSDSEKLCPSCKHIVLVSEYPSHVSKCLHKFSYSKDKSNTKEISRILPCPVCLKAFSSSNEKQTHVKLCGFSHGLTPQQIIEASKLQTKQEEERLALGLPSPQVIQNSKETRKRTDSSEPRGSKSSDPELELAYALSRSLVEEERKNREIEEDKLVSLGLHDVLQEKRRKLVLPQPPPLRPSSTRGLKGKRKGKPLTLLMTRTREERESIMTEKVAAILAGEFDSPVILPPESRSYFRQSSNFIDDDRYDTELRLWKFAQTGLEVPSASYYVTELSDYVKPEVIPFADLLKKYSGVPGKLNYTALAEDSDEENEDFDAGAPVETTIVDAYCTQLALAELLCSQDVDDLTFTTHGEDMENTRKKGTVNYLTGLSSHENDNSVVQRENLNVTCRSNNNNKNTLLDSYEIESKGKNNNFEEKKSNHETVLQTSGTVQENPKVNNDVELVCLSSDDDDATSSTVSFSPRKIQGNDNDPSSTVSLSLRKIQENDNVISFSPRKIQENNATSSTIPFSPRKIQENDNDSSSTVSFSPGKIQEDDNALSTTVTFSPGKFQDNNATSSTLPFSPRKIQENDHASSSTVSEIQEHDNALSSTVLFSPRKIQKETELLKPYRNLVSPVQTENVAVKRTIEPSSPTDTSSKVLERDTPFYSKLIYDWSCLLATGENSDIVIQTEESEIQAHSLVLHCRCSKILLDVTEEAPSNLMKENFSVNKKWLNWSNFSYDSSYAFIIYLYTGGCPVKQKDKDGTWLGLYDLALKYDCSELIEHLESMYKTSSRNATENEYTENTEECSNSEPVVENIKDKDTQSLVNNCNYTQWQRTPLSVISKCGSPDIFGEWDAGEQSSDLINSINVTPPGATLGDNTLQSFKSPVLNLESTSPYYPVNTTKNSESKTDDENEAEDITDCVGNKSVTSEKSNKEISKRNLSYEFKEVADTLPKDNHSSLVDNPDSPPLRMSSFSDFDYPSVNEIVDLTVSSDQSHNEEDPEASRHGNLGGLAKDYEEKDTPLPSLDFQDDNDEDCPDLSSLINKPTSNTSLNSYHIEILSPKKISGNEALSDDPFHRGVSDDSLLKAVCDMEDNPQTVERKQLGKKPSKNPSQKLYKSKSCFETGTTSMVTPNKGSDKLPLNSNFNITPMPDYKSMMSPELKRELDKYGIRKMSRKKAVTLLLHIYEETHPFVTDSEAEESLIDSPEITKKSLPAPPPAKTRGGKAKRGSARGKKTEAKKSCHVDLNSSQSSNSSANTSFDCLEETFLPASQDEMDDITPTQGVSLENRLKIFIRSDDELYSRILKYEPIWANELHKDLKLNGIKCSMAKLIAFLDEQCITFRLPSRERTRKRRKISSPGRSPKKKKKS